MALSVDTVSAGASDPSTTTLTWSHTTATDANLIVVTVGESRAVTISSITYNGAALTASASVTNGNSRAYVYYRVNPDKGANDVVVTYSGAITVPRAGAVTFKGANMVGPIGATNTKTGTAQNKTIDLTTRYDGSATVECVGALGGIHTAGSGQTVINAGGNNRIGFYELQGDAGLYTQNLTADSSADYSYVVVEVRAGSDDYSLDLESGSSQYASITDASQTGLDITGDMTIENWVKFESLPTSGNQMTFVNKWITTGNQRSYIWNYINDSGTLKFQFAVSDNGTDGSFPTATYTLATGVWYHTAITYNASAGTCIFYLNGRNIGTGSSLKTSIHNGTDAFSVGQRQSSSYLDGLIKDVRIFNDIRTAAEIASDAGKKSVSDANLQGEWNFDNAYTDASGNGNTLTSSGSPVFITDVPYTNATQVSGSTYLETSLQGYWTLDETSSTRADSTANNNDLTDNNTVLYAAGKQSNAADFEKDTTEYLSLAHASQTGLSFDRTDSFSIAGWVKRESTGASMGVFSKAANGLTGAGYYFYFPSNDLIRFIIQNTDTNRLMMATGSNTSTAWQHIAVTYSGGSAASSVKIYVNGVDMALTTETAALSSATTNTVAINVGALGSAAHYYDGLIDELSVHSRALHYGDILDLYNGGSGITWEATTSATGVGDLMLLGVGA